MFVALLGFHHQITRFLISGDEESGAWNFRPYIQSNMKPCSLFAMAISQSQPSFWLVCCWAASISPYRRVRLFSFTTLYTFLSTNSMPDFHCNTIIFSKEVSVNCSVSVPTRGRSGRTSHRLLDLLVVRRMSHHLCSRWQGFVSSIWPPCDHSTDSYVFGDTININRPHSHHLSGHTDCRILEL